MNNREFFNNYKKYYFPAIDLEENIIQYGYGSYVWDIEGKKILDLNGGQFSAIFGHSNKEFSSYLSKKLNIIQHTNTATITEDSLYALKKLNEIADELDPSSIILSTGSEAIELALRYSKHYTDKNGVLCFTNGYHGLTLGSQSVTFGGIYANPDIKNIYSVEPVEENDNAEEQKYKIDNLKKVLKENNQKIAVFIIEPIVSVGGMKFPSKEYLKEIRELCDFYNVLLCFDECQTGIGRTGDWFYYKKVNTVPDILVSAKGVGLGFPVSFVSFNTRKLNLEKITMKHYSSHQNDPIQAAIITFVIDYIKDNNILDIVEKKGEYFLKKLKEVENRYEKVVNSRGAGLMLAADFEIKGISNYRKHTSIFIKEMLNNGVMLQSTNGGKTLRFLPNYLITFDEINTFFNIFEKVLSKEIGFIYDI